MARAARASATTSSIARSGVDGGEVRYAWNAQWPVTAPSAAACTQASPTGAAPRSIASARAPAARARRAAWATARANTGGVSASRRPSPVTSTRGARAPRTG